MFPVANLQFLNHIYNTKSGKYKILTLFYHNFMNFAIFSDDKYSAREFTVPYFHAINGIDTVGSIVRG